MKKPSEYLDLGRFMISPGRKIHGCSFELTEGKAETIEKLGKILSDLGLKCSLLFFETVEKPRGIIFIDFSDSPVEPHEAIKRAIEELPEVTNYHCIEPQATGLLIDTASFPITVAGERIILLRSSGLKTLINGLKRQIGAAAAEALLYNIGLEIGRGLGEAHKRLAAKLGIADPVQIFRKISIPLFTALGYGVIHIKELQLKTRPRIILHIYNCIECEVAEASSQPACHLVRGMVEGGAVVILGLELTSKENKCIALGDPYCELELIPK